MTRLDIAYEEVEDLLENDDLSHQMKQYRGLQIHQIDIFRTNDLIHNEPGRYVTIEFSSLNDHDERDNAAEVVCDVLKQMLNQPFEKILVVGLGNQNVTADSLGPDTAAKVLVNAHLSEDVRGECPQIAVIAPGVMGQTGIETAKIVRSICQSEDFDVVIAIDALATKSLKRINHMIQISDTGIHPGSGVKNKRMGLNEKTLGVKVISIGVATVMSVEHLIQEKLHEMGYGDSKYNQLDDLDMVVTPKEMDEVKLHLSDVLALGINRALNQHFNQM